MRAISASCCFVLVIDLLLFDMSRRPKYFIRASLCRLSNYFFVSKVYVCSLLRRDTMKYMDVLVV